MSLITGGTVTQYVVPDQFDEVRNAPLWKNWAPRFAATYDLHGDGKTAVRASWGKYLDQIGTGTPGPNPNGAVSQRYTWNDLNSDLVFQPGNAIWDGVRYVGGEFGALANNGTSIPNPNRFDPRGAYLPQRAHRRLRPRDLPGVRGSATYIRKREKNPITTIWVPPDQWVTSYVPMPVIDPGVDGVNGTADDATVTGLQHNPRTDTELPAGQQRSSRNPVRRPRIDRREAVRTGLRASGRLHVRADASRSVEPGVSERS